MKATRSDWISIGGLALCMAAPILTALGHHISRPYLTTPDQDIVHVYEALRMGQGLPQHYDDHTGYVPFVLLSWWFKALKAVGLLSVARLDHLPPPSPAFDAAYQALTQAGRLWSALLSSGFVLAMYAGLRRLTGLDRLALLLTALFATSEGLARQALILRTELTAALFAFAAFFLLLEAIRAPERPRLMLFTGLTAALALMAKMQAIFLLAAFPALALAFGRKLALPPEYEADPGETLLWLLTSAAMAIVAGVMLVPSIRGSGAYQTALVAYGMAGMIGYARLYRVPCANAWQGACALVMGLACGQSLHLLYHTPATTEALVNFVEHMSRFSSVSDSPHLGIGAISAAIGGTLVHNLSLTPWHARLVQGAALALAAWTWSNGHPRLALQGLLLLGVSLSFEALCALRDFAPHYYVFTEGWGILALAVQLPALWRRDARSVAIALALIVATQIPTLFSGALIAGQPPGNACGQADYMTIRAAFCP